MKTDKEILELAAKAAGIDLTFEMDGSPTHWSEHTSLGAWNPHTSDGDALRLAVKLGMQIMRDYKFAEVTARIDSHFMNEFLGNDPYAATRRAIVRAAAEMAKEMK